MEKQYEKKITWTIKNLSFLKPEKVSSDQFVVGGCKLRLQAYPKGSWINDDHMSLYLVVADSESLPCGWRRHAKCRMTIVNQLSDKLSQVEELQKWFDQSSSMYSVPKRLLLTKLHAKDGGFVVNNEVKIVAEVEVLEVIGKLDALGETSYVVQTMNVNGFQVLPSQVETARLLFERHPNIAVEVRAKNQHLKNACMSFLLSLVETLCQSIQELSNEDLVEADIALTYLKDARFKVDWLEKKLSQVIEKKEKEQLGLARLPEMKNGLAKQKQICSDMEDLVKKEEADLSATRYPLPLDEVV